jgi:sporulation protein YlmC with PRC-barrel domain
MTTTSKTAIISVAFFTAVGATSDVSAQSALRDRVASAIEIVEAACAADISKFCGNVSRGEGRVVVCMQAHDDQLSYRCQFGLYRASRNLDRALGRVERIADACWNDIEAQCRDAQKIGQCVMDAPSLSQACQTVVSGIRQALHGLASLKGMPAYSSDGKNMGNVVDVVRDSEGKVKSVQIEMPGFLGFGGRLVTIDASTIEQVADRIKLLLTSDAIRSQSDAKKQ